MLPQGTCEDTKLNLLFQPGGEDDNSWSRSQELKLPSDEDTARDYHRMVNVPNAAPISAPHSLQPPAEIYKSLGNLAMGVFSRTGPRSAKNLVTCPRDLHSVGQESRDQPCDLPSVGPESRDLPCDLSSVVQTSRDLPYDMFSSSPCPCTPGPEIQREAFRHFKNASLA